MFKKRFIIILLYSIPTLTAAQNGVWSSHTYFEDIREIKLINGIIWSATGGGVLKYDTRNMSIETVTNTNGLTSNGLLSLDIDNDGNIWFATSTGDFNIYHPESDTWEFIPEFRGINIFNLVIVRNSILVATENGVSLYLIDKEEIKESYNQLGTFPFETPVNTIFINENHIWVGTDLGIAVADMALPNLLAPGSWANHTINDGLSDNQVMDFAFLNGRLYAGTSNGISYFDNDMWSIVNDGLTSLKIKSLMVFDDILYAGTDNGVYNLDELNNIWIRIGPTVSGVSDFLIDENNTIWVGRSDNGLNFLQEGNAEWEIVEFNGPGGPKFSALALSEDGILWCASALFPGIGGNGFYRFDTRSAIWSNFSRGTHGLGNDQSLAVDVDLRGNAWFGQWGGGGIFISSSGDSLSSLNDHLSAVSATGFTVVPEITIDKNTGNVWIATAEAMDNRVIAVDSSGIWFYFTSEKLPAASKKPIKIAIDNRGRAWFGVGYYGVDARGIGILDYNGTLGDLSDDIWSTVNVSDGLLSAEITALEADDDGNMWIGTTAGLNLYENDQVENNQIKVKPIAELLGRRVNDISIDYRGNKWFATNAGLSLFSREAIWTHYTTESSGLVSDDVFSVLHDRITGKVYAGTSNGLSVFQTRFIEPKIKLTGLTIYPNPWLVTDTKTNCNCVTIDGLTEDSSVSILDLNGRIIRYFSVLSGDLSGRLVQWDGTDSIGNRVASGIYIVVVETESGDIIRGKIALVR